MRVVRDDGEDAGPGDTGEIWLRTGSVMDGYLHDAQATAAAFAPGGWYRTGDLARLDDAGYLFIVDRTDRKSTRLNSSHLVISYAVFCLKKKKTTERARR